MKIPFGLWFVGLGALGCGGQSGAISNDNPSGTLSTASVGHDDAGAVTSAASGLPCDIFALLQSHCVACHSAPPIGGAPMALETLTDLSAPAHSNPAKTVAEISVTRVTSAVAPMPPAGQPALSAAEVAALQAWVSAGAMAGSCGASNGGASGPSPYDTPPQCSSGVTSTVREGSRMRPGDTCVSCHAQSGGEAPPLTIGGTVYKTAHEPTLCEGANVSGANVVITDANGQSFTISVNSAGNFYSSTGVATPFHAKVVTSVGERAMSAAQTSGDCNSCHTESGANSAPGRIMLP